MAMREMQEGKNMKILPDLNPENITQIVKEDFNALWSFKVHNEVIELITPFATVTQKFASVFVSHGNSEILITDEGWITGQDQVYRTKVDPYDPIVEHYAKEFEIETHYRPYRIVYLKRAANLKLLSTAVSDLASFIVNTVNFSLLRETFRFQIDENNSE